MYYFIYLKLRWVTNTIWALVYKNIINNIAIEVWINVHLRVKDTKIIYVYASKNIETYTKYDVKIINKKIKYAIHEKL